MAVTTYTELPIILLSGYFNKDLLLENIIVLNHDLHIIDDLFIKWDGSFIKYKEFTSIDDKLYPTGNDSELDYMPEDDVAPVMLQINGTIYKTDRLEWMILKDSYDCIKIKEHIEQTSLYPFYIKKNINALNQITSCIGHHYYRMLPRARIVN